MSIQKKQVINGVFWTFAQQFSVQVINFGVQVILARLLAPSDFGLIAMLTVFISIGSTLMDSGMTSSLIRMKQPDQLDYSTVFVTNFLVSVGAYFFIFLFAPVISKFYTQDILTNLLRIYALTFVIRAFIAVHIAKLTKEMNFKTQMKLQVPSTVISAFVGVFMAYRGYGVWSLVGLNLVQAIVFTVQCWVFIKWRPSFVFNKSKFKYHFSFGYKLTLSGLLDTIYNDAYRIVIGKFYSPAQVGYFNQAETMRLFPVQQISTVLDKVTYPLFSNINGDDKLRLAYKITMQLVLFVTIPVMFVLILVAKESFYFLFGEKWLPAVPYFQILAVASIIRPISVYNLNILKVKGRSDLFLSLEVVKKIIGVSVLLIGLSFGIMGLVVALTGVSFLFTFINMFFCGKLISYSIWKQMKDISKLLIIGILVFFASQLMYIYLVKMTDSNLSIILSIALFYSVLYLSSIYMFEKSLITQIKKIFKK